MFINKAVKSIPFKRHKNGNLKGEEEGSKCYDWNVKSCGFNAASQQTLSIVSGSPSNKM